MEADQEKPHQKLNRQLAMIANAHTNTQAFTLVRVHTHTHTRTHPHTQRHTPAHTRMHTRPHPQPHPYTCTHTHIHTHSCIHLNTQRHTVTTGFNNSFFPSVVSWTPEDLQLYFFIYFNVSPPAINPPPTPPDWATKNTANFVVWQLKFIFYSILHSLPWCPRSRL